MYFTYKDGVYTPDSNGTLCGIDGTDPSGHTYYAVAFMPQFTSLQNATEISWIYKVQFQPVGTTAWKEWSTGSIVFSNSNFVHAQTGAPVEPDNPNAVGELDFIVSHVFKAEGNRVNFYQVIMDRLAVLAQEAAPQVRWYKD